MLFPRLNAGRGVTGPRGQAFSQGTELVNILLRHQDVIGMNCRRDLFLIQPLEDEGDDPRSVPFGKVGHGTNEGTLCLPDFRFEQGIRAEILSHNGREAIMTSFPHRSQSSKSAAIIHGCNQYALARGQRLQDFPSSLVPANRGLGFLNTSVHYAPGT
jgi:hypothetical protein